MTTTVLGGRYELKQKLGSGGMATVYEAHDGLLGRAVAVKLLRSDALSEGTARQRFAAEARAAASLTHPYAVAVYDVNSAGEQPFIVMELVRGRPLDEVLADGGRFDEAEVVAVGSQVLAALHAAHNRGLVHRDVKPANILLPDGVVPFKPDQLPGAKLADFGIAKATEEAASGLTRMGQVIGTPRYLSPEQVGGERATPKSDLYSTALVLYEMLAGRAPFERDTALGLALAHRDDAPPPLSDFRRDVDRGLAAVVHRALSKNPDERYADAQEMRSALIAAASGMAPETALLGAAPAGAQAVRRSDAAGMDDGTEAIAGTAAPTRAPEVRTEPRSDAPRRRGWWLAALVALAAMGTAAAVWFATRPDTAEEPSVPTGAEQQTAEPTEEPEREQQVPPLEETEQEQQEAVPPPGQDPPQQDEQPAEEPPAQPTEEPADGEPAEEDPGEEEPPEENTEPPSQEEPPEEEPPPQGAGPQPSE